MPRLVFAISLALILAACDVIAPTPTPHFVVITDPPPNVAPTPTPGSPPTPVGPIEWQVNLLQDGQPLPMANDMVALARAPFTIRVSLPAPVPVKLNAYNSDQNFQDLQPGFTLTPDCVFALCAGMDVAEERLNPNRMLFVDVELTHYLYYAGPDDHRWSRAEVGASGAVFEREVAFLNDIPIGLAADPAIYLLFFVNEDNPDQIDPGELKKITVILQ